MKKLISIFALLSLLVAMAPSYATWYCSTTNARQAGTWTWHGPIKANVVTNAMRLCAQAYGTPTSGTYDPATCRITTCWQQ